MAEHVFIDPQQIEAEIAKGDAVLRGLIDEPGTKGTFARLSLAVATSFSRHMGVEINRGTAPDELRDALCMVVANMIGDLIESSTDDGVDPIPHYITTLQQIANCLMSRARGESEQVFRSNIPATPMGAA